MSAEEILYGEGAASYPFVLFLDPQLTTSIAITLHNAKRARKPGFAEIWEKLAAAAGVETSASWGEVSGMLRMKFNRKERIELKLDPPERRALAHEFRSNHIIGSPEQRRLINAVCETLEMRDG